MRQVFSNSRNNYHCTMFHTSHPSDGGADPCTAPAERPSLSDADIAAELAAVAAVVAQTAPPRLRAERVVMTRSGTLLLTWTDLTGAVTQLRRRLRDTFPGV